MKDEYGNAVKPPQSSIREAQVEQLAKHLPPESKTMLRAIAGILDLPTYLEKKSLRWILTLLVIVILVMGVVGMVYFQKQLLSLQEKYDLMVSRNTEYLIQANAATTGALDRNTYVLRRVEERLDQINRN